MKNILSFGAFLSLIVLQFLLLLPLVSHAQPKIVFEKEVHNFGDVMQGDVVEHTFEFQNKGNEELVIDKVSPS